MLFTRKVFSTEDEPAVRLATIEISQDDARAILNIMDKVERMKDPVYGRPDSISFRDGSPSWYGEEDEDENGEVIPLGDPISTEIDLINIERDGVSWSCYAKHGDYLYETHEVTKEEIAAILTWKQPKG
jgi:hypothetical protein